MTVRSNPGDNLRAMALRQTTGFDESLLRLVGLDWTVPHFSTLSRRQKTLAVNIAYRGSKGPLHLLIDSAGIAVLNGYTALGIPVTEAVG